MLTVYPSKIHGSINIQASKSVIHRALICSALAKGESLINNITYSDDIFATLNALRSLGFCDYYQIDNKIYINGGLNKCPEHNILCGESGTTLRILLPLACLGKKICFNTKGRLSKRPMGPYEDLFKEKGVNFNINEDNFIIDGVLKPGKYHIPGNISSQFISGLLFKLPMLNANSIINIVTEIESKPYINLTRHYQSIFGVYSVWENNSIFIDGGQQYKAANIWAEGDYSHAAFFAVGAALSGNINMKGLDMNSQQGDKKILTILNKMGAKIDYSENDIKITKSKLKPLDIDVADIPDLAPILAVAACGTLGKTTIFNAKRLRYKESDRLAAIATELQKIGADILEYEDKLIINGTGKLHGGEISSHNDHRIAMALTIASCIAQKNIIIDFPEAVNKSAPKFFEQFESLGGVIK